MGVRVLYDRDERVAVLYDSVSGHAFGPLIQESQFPEGWTIDAREAADTFLLWLQEDRPEMPDVRTLPGPTIETLYAEWRAASDRDEVDA